MVNFHPHIGLAGAVVKRQALVATPSRPTRPLRNAAAVNNPTTPQEVTAPLDPSSQNTQPKPNTNLDFDIGNPFGIFGPDDPEPTLTPTRTRSRLFPLPTQPSVTDPLTTPAIPTDSNGFPLFTGTSTSSTSTESSTSSTPTPTPESTLVTVTQTLPPSSTPSSDSASAPPKGFLQNKSVAGPVIGVLSVLAFLILATVFIFCYRMNRRKKLMREAISFDPAGMMEYGNDTERLTNAPVHRGSTEKPRYSGYGSSEGHGGTESGYGGSTSYGQPSYPSMYPQQGYYPQQQQGYMYGNQGYQGYPAPNPMYDPTNRGLPPLPGGVPSRHASPAPPAPPAHDSRDAHNDNRGTLRESAAYDGLAMDGQTLKIVNE